MKEIETKVFIAKRISTRLWMKDLFLQCMYIRMYVSVMLRNVNLHSFALTCMLKYSCVTYTDDGGWGQGRTVLLDNEGCGEQHGWSSALSAERSWHWRHWERENTEVNVEKKPRRQEENERKCKRRKHVVKSLHKPGINYADFHVQFNHSPSWAHSHGMAWHEASCACVLLVFWQVHDG